MSSPIWVFPKMVVPFPQQPWVYPTKNDHFGLFWGYPYFWKHPYKNTRKMIHVRFTSEYGMVIYMSTFTDHE